MQRSRNDDVREEEIPAFVTPEDLQAKQGFIPLAAPELAAAFHSTLHLPVKGVSPGYSKKAGVSKKAVKS